ncbi:MAG: BrnT family toxin [Opitutaceae bacterium]
MAFDPARYTGFEWDTGNLTKNSAKHDVTCREAEEIFFNQPLIVAPDPAHSRTEPRFRALGRTNTDRLLHLNFTLRGDKLRIISARPTNRQERTAYEKYQS